MSQLDNPLESIIASSCANSLAGGAGVPATILGALLHSSFDSRDGGILLNAGNVSSWPNRGSDGAALIQGTAAQQPAYAANGWSAGIPSVTFDGVDDRLVSTFNGAIAIGARPQLWVVGKFLDAAPATVAMMSQISDDVSGGFTNGVDNRIPAGGGAWATFRSDSSGSGTTTGGTNNTAAHVWRYGFTVGGTASLVIDNSVSINTPQNGAPTVNMLQSLLGGYGGFSSLAHCVVAAFIIANAQPSAAQDAAMWSYFRSGPWGLTVA